MIADMTGEFSLLTISSQKPHQNLFISETIRHEKTRELSYYNSLANNLVGCDGCSETILLHAESSYHRHDTANYREDTQYKW